MYIPEPKKTPTGWRIQLRINGQSIPVMADTPKECRRKAALFKAEAQNAAKPVKKCAHAGHRRLYLRAQQHAFPLHHSRLPHHSAHALPVHYAARPLPHQSLRMARHRQ